MGISWKKVPGFPNYSVSEDGRVRNDKRGTDKVLSTTPFGYKFVLLWHKNEQKLFYIQRLVHAVHNAPISEGMEIHHKNNLSDDNRKDNLEEVSKSDNLGYMRNRNR